MLPIIQDAAFLQRSLPWRIALVFFPPQLNIVFTKWFCFVLFYSRSIQFPVITPVNKYCFIRKGGKSLWSLTLSKRQSTSDYKTEGELDPWSINEGTYKIAIDSYSVWDTQGENSGVYYGWKPSSKYSFRMFLGKQRELTPALPPRVYIFLLPPKATSVSLMRFGNECSAP